MHLQLIKFKDLWHSKSFPFTNGLINIQGDLQPLWRISSIRVASSHSLLPTSLLKPCTRRWPLSTAKLQFWSQCKLNDLYNCLNTILKVGMVDLIWTPKLHACTDWLISTPRHGTCWPNLQSKPYLHKKEICVTRFMIGAVISDLAKQSHQNGWKMWHSKKKNI